MATAHAHQGLVALAAGPADGLGRRPFSSGLLVAPRLVLTCRHGVALAGGIAQMGVEVQLVAGPRGHVRLGESMPGQVAWQGPGDLDAALVELSVRKPPDWFVPRGLAWGEPIGARPLEVTVTGMPGFAARSTGNRAEIETVRGSLEPGTYTAQDRYAINLEQGWPQGWKDWAGVSGAAVTCVVGGQLVGVVAWSDEPLEGRRLTAVTVRTLLADPGFREVLSQHLGRIPECEPVELAPYLSRTQTVGSLGGLLRADAAVVGFTGRDQEIGILERWRDQSAVRWPDVKAILVTGRGGEGKTRLAMEFLARSRQESWTGGLMRSSASSGRDRSFGAAPRARHRLRCGPRL